MSWRFSTPFRLQACCDRPLVVSVTCTHDYRVPAPGDHPRARGPRVGSGLRRRPPCNAIRCRASESKAASSAVKDLKKALGVSGNADPVYSAAAAYLASIGFSSQAEIARVLDIAMNPSSLFVSFNESKRSGNSKARPLDVEKDIKPVVEFLQGRGISKEEIVKVINAHPAVLCYSVPQRLEPFWSYLEDVGVADVAATVQRRPSLLGLDVDDGLRKIVSYLQYTDTPPETIAKYLAESI